MENALNDDKVKSGGSTICCPPSALLKFYAAFVIFCLGDRIWSFSNAFFFELLGGMRLVSLDQFVESLSAVLLSTWVGKWLDQRDRRKGAMTMVAANNSGLALSAALLAACLLIGTNYDEKRSTPLLNAAFIVSLVAAIALSALTKSAAEGERLVFTKDWIVVLAKQVDAGKKIDVAASSSSLSKRNATMVVIDQLASVLGPLMAGFVLAWFGHKFACLLIVGWNIFALIATRLLLNNVYGNVADLAVRVQNEQEKMEQIKCDDGKSAAQSKGEQKIVEKEGQRKRRRRTFPMLGQIRTYYRQSVFAAAFGLALLYATVLGFDGLAVSFGKAQGMEDDAIGMFRSASSFLGLLGALSFAPAERRIGLRRTGLLGLSAQHVCLWICVVSIWLPGSPFDPIGYAHQWRLGTWVHSSRSAFDGQHAGNGTTTTTLHSLPWPQPSIYVFFAGITLARFGLWMADLAIIQLMQLGTPEAERGTVFGVQNGFSQLFSMLKDVLVILLPDPRTFGLLIIFSIFCVGFGFFQYIHYLLKTRKDNVDKKGVKEEAEIGPGRNGRYEEKEEEKF